MNIRFTVICSALSVAVISFSVNAAVPNTFTAGTKARASQVNENFKSLDDRVSAIESGGAINVVKYPHSLNSYVKKVAEVGDVISTIEGVEYVLGVLPFREYASGTLYKVIMPMERHECDRSESSIHEGNGYRYTYNYQCGNGSQYYYEESFTATHSLWPLVSNELISGFPASFSAYQGESATISILKKESVAFSFTDLESDPREYVYEKEVTPQVSIVRSQGLGGLTIKVGETALRFGYSPKSRYGIPYSKGTLQNSGPDFTSNFPLSELNDHMDLDLLNEYKNLYNYISIEVFE